MAMLSRVRIQIQIYLRVTTRQTLLLRPNRPVGMSERSCGEGRREDRYSTSSYYITNVPPLLLGLHRSRRLAISQE